MAKRKNISKEYGAISTKQKTSLYNRIKSILEQARQSAVRSVNTSQVLAYWMIGREIVEEEQQGLTRAAYGKNLLNTLSKQLKSDYGYGVSPYNLGLMRRFYQEFPTLLEEKSIQYSLRTKSNIQCV